MSLETVDFGRLDLQPRTRVLDVGCGEGRHALSAWLHGAGAVVGVDIATEDLATAASRRDAFVGAARDGPPSRISPPAFVRASALALPFPEAAFDVVICAEVLEHVRDPRAVLAEIRRVLRPGGTFVASVPRWWPERICWLLSDAYHEAPGGHLRIFREGELRRLIETFGFRTVARHWAHALHAPYWWLRCLAGTQPERSRAVRAYHRLLVWDLMHAPRSTRRLERLLDPLMGKSLVLYFEAPPESNRSPREEHP